MTDHDIALTDLPRMEQSLLWAMRTWVTGRRVGEDMGAKIESVFGHVGVTEAAQPLEGFLWVLSQGLRRTLQVHCTCQAEVSADESRLLLLFSLLGADRTQEAEALLREIASDRAALLACDCALRVMLRFRAVGFGATAAPPRAAVVPLRQARTMH